MPVSPRRLPPYGNNTLPAGVKPRLVPNVNGLTVNMLEAGTQGRPLVLLLHGFPNLGYSWRKVMPAFADAGYYVIAPDCRGYGRTVGWDRSWDADPTPFLTLNMVRDQIALVSALGYRKAELIVGHDQGQLIATYAAIVRPDMFLRLTTVSSAGGAPPSFPFAGTVRKPAYTAAELDAEFAKLNPPRRDYQEYWASKQADEDMKHMSQSMSDFFRAFYYMKGGEFPGNQNLTPLRPMPTAREAAAENARMPEYYVMRRDRESRTRWSRTCRRRSTSPNVSGSLRRSAMSMGRNSTPRGGLGPCTITGTAVPRFPIVPATGLRRNSQEL
jgi:pimeloyl-ACP methyl ester carboxylesterase